MHALALRSRLFTGTRRKVAAVAFTLSMAFSTTVGDAAAASYTTIYASHPGVALCSRQFGYVNFYTRMPSAASIPAQNTILTTQLMTTDSYGRFTRLVATVTFDRYTSVWQPSTGYYSDAWYSVANGRQLSSDLSFTVADYGYFHFIVKFTVKGSSGLPKTVYSNPLMCPASF